MGVPIAISFRQLNTTGELGTNGACVSKRSRVASCSRRQQVPYVRVRVDDLSGFLFLVFI